MIKTYSLPCNSSLMSSDGAGFIVVFVYLVLKYLGVCDVETETYAIEDPPPSPVREVTETAPMIPQKQVRLSYGTNEGDDEGGSSSSSEDLYDAKLCVICYDEQRNCFIVPCGHCATCYDCTQRWKFNDDHKLLKELKVLIWKWL